MKARAEDAFNPRLVKLLPKSKFNIKLKAHKITDMTIITDIVDVQNFFTEFQRLIDPKNSTPTAPINIDDNRLRISKKRLK